MENTETNVQDAPLHYNPNQLVTYKLINSEGTSYPTEKVNQIEYALHIAREDRSRANDLQNTISSITGNLTMDYWYNPNTSKEEILSELCEILKHSPTQTVRISGNIRVEINYECPIEDIESLDARDFLQENISVDTYNGDVELDLVDFDDGIVDW